MGKGGAKCWSYCYPHEGLLTQLRNYSFSPPQQRLYTFIVEASQKAWLTHVNPDLPIPYNPAYRRLLPNTGITPRGSWDRLGLTMRMGKLRTVTCNERKAHVNSGSN